MHMAKRALPKANPHVAAGQHVRAQELAVAALEFIASEPRRLARFLDMTGIALESIRAASEGSNFLAGVLDHLSDDEALLLAFCERAGIAPQEMARARAVFSGEPWERDSP
jgi:hypothetical protein